MPSMMPPTGPPMTREQFLADKELRHKQFMQGEIKIGPEYFYHGRGRSPPRDAMGPRIVPVPKSPGFPPPPPKAAGVNPPPPPPKANPNWQEVRDQGLKTLKEEKDARDRSPQKPPSRGWKGYHGSWSRSQSPKKSWDYSKHDKQDKWGRDKWGQHDSWDDQHVAYDGAKHDSWGKHEETEVAWGWEHKHRDSRNGKG